ncbi:MAG: hypothetical protein Kow0062_13530 [Acidobacteriota bacterium]
MQAPSDDAIERAETVRRAIQEGNDPVPAAVQGLGDADPLVRGTTVSLLLSAETHLVTEVVTTWQRERGPLYAPDRSVELRMLACELVGRDDIAAVDRRRVCTEGLRDRDPLIRSRAVARCTAAGLLDEAAIERALGDPHWAVRTRLATSIAGAPDGAAACAVGRRLAGDTHATVRSAASPALARCQDNDD